MSSENSRHAEGGLTRRGFIQVAGLAGAVTGLSARLARAEGQIGYYATDLSDDQLKRMLRTILRIRWHETCARVALATAMGSDRLAQLRVAERLGWSDAFGYESAADVFREHAALSGFENDGERVFDISGLANITDDAYRALEPVQWPVVGNAGGSQRVGEGAAHGRGG